MYSAAKINSPVKIRSIYSISEIAARHTQMTMVQQQKEQKIRLM